MKKQRSHCVLVISVLLFCFSAADAAVLGRKVGEFSLRKPAPVLPKPTAASPRPLPPPGKRVLAMARVTPEFKPESLKPYGWRLVHLYKGFAGLEGDDAVYSLLLDIPGVVELQRPSPVEPQMDSVRASARATGVQAWGTNQPQNGVSGKGVMVGIVDDGLDSHHSAFLDASGKTRFLAMWDLDLSDDGSSLFGFGRVKTQAQLTIDTTFGARNHHGTHVLSIAAGSGKGNPYFGMAPEASLIGVRGGETALGAATHANFDLQVMYGIQWMFHVADSLKMPAVINLSIGHEFGPHDGTSIFDRFLDSITGPGRIVVGCACNYGGTTSHVRLAPAAGDTAGTWTEAGTEGTLDMWGESATPFRFQLLLKKTGSNDYAVSKEFLSTDSGTGKERTDNIDWGAPGATVNTRLTWTLEKSNPGNQRPHLRATARSSVATTSLGIRIVGGSLQGWCPQGGCVSNSLPGYVEGDTLSSTCETGGTSKSIITVGAYTSKLKYTTHDGLATEYPGKVGDYAGFTARGPTLDGRVKPDISAPGVVVAGALTNDDINFPGIVLWPDLNSKQGRYMMASGTSMASPAVAGIVALMLQANPKLTPQQAKAILQETAYKDAFTGPLRAPSNLWGAGKVDATAAVRRVQAGGARIVDFPGAGAPGKAWAHFVGGQLRVEGLSFTGEVTGTVYDWRGSRVASLASLGNNRFLPGRKLNPGVYIAVLQSRGMDYALRWVRE